MKNSIFAKREKYINAYKVLRRIECMTKYVRAILSFIAMIVPVCSSSEPCFLKDSAGDTLINNTIAPCDINNPFTDRVKNFWQWFGEHSTELENLIATNKKGWDVKMQEIMAEGLAIIGKGICYNIGGKNELTFTAEEKTERHYLFPWLVKSMPDNLKKRWTVFPCKQPDNMPDCNFVMYGKEVNMHDVMVSADYDSETNTFALKYYHPALAALSEDKCTIAFSIILEMIIGEGSVFNYIDKVTLADSADGLFQLDKLPSEMKYVLEKNGHKYSTEPLFPYSVYSCNPDENEKRIRFDIISGSTQYYQLNDEYYNDKRDTYDALAALGAEAIMLILTQPEGMDYKDFIDMRYKVEDRLIKLFDRSVLHGRLLGGAYGIMGLAYIDLLLYDGPQFIDYLKNDGVLDELLRMDNGGVCPVEVCYKDFTPDSPLIQLR